MRQSAQVQYAIAVAVRFISPSLSFSMWEGVSAFGPPDPPTGDRDHTQMRLALARPDAFDFPARCGLVPLLISTPARPLLAGLVVGAGALASLSPFRRPPRHSHDAATATVPMVPHSLLTTSLRQ
jgi:hypothetical protein